MRIRYKWRSFKWGIRNLWRWFPVVWADRDWDYDYLLMMMEKKFDFMVEASEGWCSVSSEKYRREMMICRRVIRRIRKEDYKGIVEVFGRSRKAEKAAWKLQDKQMRDDLRLFGKTFVKVQSWWD